MKWYDDLVDICKLYDSKFELRKDEEHHGYNKKNIVYLAYDKGDIISTQQIIKSFPHELAHRIQHSIWGGEKIDVNSYFYDNFDRVLKYELVADELAYFIAKEYFPRCFKDLNTKKSDYNSYSTKEEEEFLAKHYSFKKDKNDIYKSIIKDWV